MNKFDFSKTFAAGFKGLSRLIMTFSSVEQKTFVKGLRFWLPKTARENFPNKSISELAHMTGLQRNQVSEALDDDSPVPVMDKESIILSDLWHHRDKDGLLPISGKQKNSFQTIVSSHLKGRYPVSAIKRSLIKSGVIREERDHFVILSSAFRINYDQVRMINQTGLILERFVETMIHNLNVIDGDLNYQSSYKSTKIPARNMKEFHKDLYTCSKTVMQMYKDIFKRYEVDVPNGRYPECGISIFEFNARQNNKGEDNE